ncbi:Reverse transcriptase Ty1/copia-type domain-containing protein [Forsythia ovata]|uniref:Reverse transcriptase Ty1/copia-type domain-containing protein n=1 Tax=Forsythia ovata TaxID=205694 RepID=A0ABD1P0B3_9LAMI
MGYLKKPVEKEKRASAQRLMKSQQLVRTPGENDDGDVLRPSPVHQLEPHSSAVDVTDQPHSSGQQLCSAFSADCQPVQLTSEDSSHPAQHVYSRRRLQSLSQGQATPEDQQSSPVPSLPVASSDSGSLSQERKPINICKRCNVSQWQKKEISLPIGRKGKTLRLSPCRCLTLFCSPVLSRPSHNPLPSTAFRGRRGCHELSTCSAWPSSSSLVWFVHLSHTGFKTSLPAAVGSALSSDGISTDNAGGWTPSRRIHGHLCYLPFFTEEPPSYKRVFRLVVKKIQELFEEEHQGYYYIKNTRRDELAATPKISKTIEKDASKISAVKSKEHGRASSSQKWEIGEKDAAKATTNKKEVLATSQKSKENYSSNVSAKVTKARERGAEESSSKDKKPAATFRKVDNKQKKKEETCSINQTEFGKGISKGFVSEEKSDNGPNPTSSSESKTSQDRHWNRPKNQAKASDLETANVSDLETISINTQTFVEGAPSSLMPLQDLAEQNGFISGIVGRMKWYEALVDIASVPGMRLGRSRSGRLA